MIKLDDNLLAELGLTALSTDDKKRMLTHIYETLEMRVGMELAKQMSDAQLSEFEQFINRNDEGGALQWLETNFPNYKEVVAVEFEKLKLEIKQVAPQILADAQAAMQGQPSAQTQMPGDVSPQPGQQFTAAPGQAQFAQNQPSYQQPAASQQVYSPVDTSFGPPAVQSTDPFALPGSNQSAPPQQNQQAGYYTQPPQGQGGPSYGQTQYPAPTPMPNGGPQQQQYYSPQQPPPQYPIQDQQSQQQ
jgi:hypothetical protein